MSPRCLIVALTVLAGASPASALVIDTFDRPLPESPRLPASRKLLLFVGPQCDGDACPPSQVVFNYESADDSRQFDVSRLPGGERRASVSCSIGDVFPEFAAIGALRRKGVFAGAGGCATELWIDPAAGGSLRIVGTSGAPPSAQIVYPLSTAGPGMDLLALGVDRFEVDVTECPAGHDSALVILIVTSDGPPAASLAVIAATVGAPGVVSLPLAEFFATVDWRTIRSIHLIVDVPGPLPGSISIGELRAVAAPTPVATASWGRVKAAYR